MNPDWWAQDFKACLALTLHLLSRKQILGFDSVIPGVTVDKSCHLSGVQLNILYDKRVRLNTGYLSFLLSSRVRGLDLAPEL